MKRVLQFLFLAIVIAVAVGFYYESQEVDSGKKIIGIGILAFSFLWMPLFIYHRYKNRDVKDYMLTEENIKKMKAHADGEE